MCVFVHYEKGIIIIIYVDDGILTCKDMKGMEYAKNDLRSVDEIKELGKVSWYLGFGFKHLPEGIAITQKSFIEETLAEVGMADCRPALTPNEL